MVCDPAINIVEVSKDEKRFLSCWVSIFNKRVKEQLGSSFTWAQGRYVTEQAVVFRILSIKQSIKLHYLAGCLFGPEAFIMSIKVSDHEWSTCVISSGWGKKRGQMPHPSSTLQHFSLITQSSHAILSILMCDFFITLTSAFAIALF